MQTNPLHEKTKQLLGFDKHDPKRLQALLDSFDYVAYVPVKPEGKQPMFLPMPPQQEQDDG